MSDPQNSPGSTTARAPRVEPRFIRPEDLAAYCGLGRYRAYELLAAGHIRAIKDGCRTLIDRESVDRYLDSRPTATIRLQRARDRQPQAPQAAE